MSPDPGNADPLYEYEQEPLPSDDDRNRRLKELKRAIQAGTYDEEEILNNLLGNIKGGFSDSGETEDDSTQP